MIRPIQKSDLPSLKTIIDETELFPSSMLDDMTRDFLDHPETTSDLWFCEVDDNEQALSVLYCGPEKMTVGTYNALLLCVRPSAQGQGCGTRLMKHLEAHLVKKLDARLLLVETSGNDEFAKTRAFYETKLGYVQEARIREFYQAGEDKIVYRKALV